MKLPDEQFGFRLSRKHVFYDVFAVAILGLMTFMMLRSALQIEYESQLRIPRILAGAGLPAAVGFLLALRYGVVDLSVWAVMGLGGLVAAGCINAGLSPWIAFVIAVGTGATIGAINALLVSRIRLPGIIITAVVALILLGAMNWIYPQRSVAVPETTFDNWVSNIHAFSDAANNGLEQITPSQDDQKPITHPGVISGPLVLMRMLIVIIAWAAVLFVLGVTDNIVPKKSHPPSPRKLRALCLCVCGAMAALSGACWLMELGDTPVPTRLIDEFTIPAAVILTGTLLLQGRGRTMLAVMFLPAAMLCASIGKQTVYPITTYGYSLQLLVLGAIVLTAQWAYVRGCDKSCKYRWFYRAGCGLAVVGLVVAGFPTQLGVGNAKAIFLSGVGISSASLVLIIVLGIISHITRKDDPKKTSTTMHKTYKTNSPAETHALAAELGATLTTGDCIALVGNLGAGKTAFVRGLADGIGCDVQLVSSPTYVLVQEYTCPNDKHIPIYHLDLYRLGNPVEEFDDLGVDEMLTNGAVVIEWADLAAEVLPRPHTQIAIDIDGPDARSWTISRIDN
ncbi:MAG: tRNA (adenosine(37)-N6)-threonylcarbamoyltransferase complex ATPase subunit type 1 TsaE [Phycisphaerae bacterium]|nr:tRNA (adenosine(37)-N6)-threonylcarbamoyltransferase complex ATPase subunit type 1 TsaE [Phycisphaerae bacterium]